MGTFPNRVRATLALGLALAVLASTANARHYDTAPNLQRDTRGRIERSHAATDQFRKSNPCPATGKTSGACPGYVIDHVIPLYRGGPDAPANMQWQSQQEAKAKDKIE